MFDDGCGTIIGLALILGGVALALYLIVIAATIVGPILAAAGVLWGGGSALKNYIVSFKENVFDSNRKSKPMGEVGV